MSANNWSVCPKCFNAAREKSYKLQEELLDKYGKIPPNEFIKLSKEAKTPTTDTIEATLREDYEIMVSKFGLFTIGYSGRCDKCGFKYDFNYGKQLEIK